MNSLKWKSYPAKAEPAKALIVALVILCVGILAGLYLKAFIVGVISSAILFVSVMKFYLPSEYQLGENEVEIKFLWMKKVYKWNTFRSVFRCKSGVLLSPFYYESRLDTFRGVLLLCKDNLEEVYSFAGEKIGK